MESPILAIDASTYTGSVAIISANRVVCEYEVAMRGRDEERLMPAVAEALKVAGIATDDIGSVACGSGPGSFTSLRIAASIAKGFAFGGGIPLYAVPSLLLMLAGSAWSTTGGRYLTVLDAMRGELFAACYEVSVGDGIREITPVALLGTAALDATAARLGASIMGIGRQLDAFPRASGVAHCNRADLLRVDLAKWEPEYGRLSEAQVRWELTNARPLNALP